MTTLTDFTEAPSHLIRLTPDELDLNDAIRFVEDPSVGAISTFSGTTRNNFAGKVVTRLEYEAYEPMAMKLLAELCDEASAKWKLHRIALFHRLGEVPVLRTSVVVCVSSEHRRESLQAVEYLIDELKVCSLDQRRTDTYCFA